MKITKFQLGFMFLLSIVVFVAGIIRLIKTPDTSPELGAALACLGLVMFFICVRTFNRKI
jgi:hypothetical protein